MYLFMSIETRGYLFYALGYNPGLLYFSGCSSMLLFKLQNKESQANLSCVKEPVFNADKFSNRTSFSPVLSPRPGSGPDTSMACASRGSGLKERRDGR